MTRMTSTIATGDDGILVFTGHDVKVKLLADRTANPDLVHVDWLRVTFPCHSVDAPPVDVLFPPEKPQYGDFLEAHEIYRGHRLRRMIADTRDLKEDKAQEAWGLAERIAKALGPDYKPLYEVRKGHDFYKYRWSIMLNDHECAWVGFQASSTSPRQQAQERTIHANISGTACTFALNGWRHRLGNIVQAEGGDITRIDLALDFFGGITGGIERVMADYKDGLCNVRGQRPKSSLIVSDHELQRGRSFYIGSKAGGKQTNVYEKGDQLFGVEANNPWMRIELRYGNKLRVLPLDCLTRPGDFFAGASDWHASMLLEAASDVANPVQDLAPQSIPCDKLTKKLQGMTVEAEAERSLRWAIRTAAPTLAVLFAHLPDADFLDLVAKVKAPARLAKFSHAQLSKAFAGLGRVISQTLGADSGQAPAYA